MKKLSALLFAIFATFSVAQANDNPPDRQSGYECIALGIIQVSRYRPGYGWETYPQQEYFYGAVSSSEQSARRSAMNECIDYPAQGCEIYRCEYQN